MWDVIGEEFEDNDLEDWILVGETIGAIEVNGHRVSIMTENGYCLQYDASDGGWSTWKIWKEG